MNLTFTQLRSELELIKKRTGKYPKKLYLTEEEFERYIEICQFPELGLVPTKQRREKMLKEGRGIKFKNIPVEVNAKN